MDVKRIVLWFYNSVIKYYSSNPLIFTYHPKPEEVVT